VLLLPRRRWFETDLRPARHAVRAIVEAARLLGKLPDRQVVVVGYAASRGSSRELGRDQVARRAAAPVDHDAASDIPSDVADGDDIGCARADVVRAFLISNGVDPRRIVISCVALDAEPEPSAAMAKRPLAGATSIVILSKNGLPRSLLIGQGVGRAVELGSGAP
jgi:hypothetical protein